MTLILGRGLAEGGTVRGVVLAAAVYYQKWRLAKALPEPVFKYRSKALFYNLFLVNVLPEDVLRYFSNSRVSPLSVKAIAVLIFHGMCLKVCLHFS